MFIASLTVGRNLKDVKSRRVDRSQRLEARRFCIMWNPFAKPKEAQAYQATTTRVMKGKIAPQGKIYCVVRYKKYVSWGLVQSAGLTENMKADIYARLFQRIKKEYGV